MGCRLKKVKNNFSQLVGNTPILEMAALAAQLCPNCRLFGKLECFNPAGSAKDRVAVSMLDDAQERGLIKSGATIIEPTSGNTGIGLAAVGVSRGYRVVLTMPETMSPERVSLMKAYGAQVVLTPGNLGMTGAIAAAEKLAAETPNSFIPGQFDNPANVMAHIKTTGPELWDQMDGEIDIFVAGIGTGGTITGNGRFLKNKCADIKIVGVEPSSSPFLTKGEKGPHGLQGIGAGFAPKILNLSVVDEILTVTEADAYQMGKAVAKAEGMLIGVSSAAAMCAGVTLGCRPENAGKNIVVFLPDSGEKYLSTPLFK